MKANTLVLALAVTVLIPGCKEDKAAPWLQFTSHIEMEKIWNQVTLAVDAFDNDEVSRVEFLVNGSELGRIGSPPWEVELDTRSMEEGTAEVSALAYDVAGNVSEEATMNLVVENILLSISIPEGYIQEDEDNILENKFVYYLASKDGVDLGSAIMGNGESREFRRPDGFNDECFDLGKGSFEKSSDDPNYFYGYVYTYMDLKPGILIYEVDKQSSLGDYTGYCYFKAGEDITRDTPYTLSGGVNIWGDIYGGDSATICLYENSNQAYFYLKEESNGFFHFYEDLVPGGNYEIKAADLEHNMVPFYIANNYLTFSNLTAQVYAYENPGDYSSGDATLIYSEVYYPSEDQSVRFHYPAGNSAVKDFMLYAMVNENSYVTHFLRQYGTLPGELPEVGASIQGVWLNLPGQVEATISGSADIQLCYLQLLEGDNTLRMHVRGPLGSPIRIPPVPSGISSAYNIPVISGENVYYYEHSLFEHSDLDGYEAISRDWAGFDPIDPYYAPGTVTVEVDYHEFYGTRKSTGTFRSPEQLHLDQRYPEQRTAERRDRLGFNCCVSASL